MDRRQLLFGATALGLATNLNLNHLLSGRVGRPALGKGRLSDRERAGLRGPVKTCRDFMGDEAESMCDAVYGTDGRLLVWRGRVSGGSRVERVYSYNEVGRLIGITGGGADGTDEFRFDEQGRRTRVRTVPPRPDRQSVGTGVAIVFEVTEEGDCLIGGGTVTTRYNDDDQPIESLVRDAYGELLACIAHEYNADGQLVHETLVRESIETPDSMFPEEVRRQLNPEHRHLLRAQLKEFVAGHEGLRSIDRSYVHDNEGRVIQRQMRMGALVQDMTIAYNEQGDQLGMVMVQGGSLDPRMKIDGQLFEVRYRYQYDNQGNWTEQTFDGSSSTTRRELTYY